MALSKKHRRTMERIRSHPVPGNLTYREILSALRAAGVEIESGQGARLKLRAPNGSVYVLHVHDERKRADKGAIANIRDWLGRNQGGLEH